MKQENIIQLCSAETDEGSCTGTAVVFDRELEIGYCEIHANQLPTSPPKENIFDIYTPKELGIYPNHEA